MRHHVGIILSSIVLIVSVWLGWRVPLAESAIATDSSQIDRLPYTPVVTPNGSTLPWTIVDGVKEFHLTVEEIMWEMAPGMTIKAWGYNGCGQVEDC